MVFAAPPARPLWIGPRVMAPDPYDLALTKVERNGPKDINDVRFLAAKVPFDLALLKHRYDKELRWQLARTSWHDTTIKLWIEMIEDDRQGR
jgi:hypothetical protein